MKILFIALGTLFLILGIIGIVVPGLPTTPFILLTGFFYLKSSKKLYNLVLNHKYLGKYLRDYKEKKAFSKKGLTKAIIMMWLMISISELFFLKNQTTQIIVFVAGIVGMIVILSLKTYKD